MAYCLRSFVQTLEQVLYPDQHHQKWVLDQEKQPQIQSLFENASFLQDFLDDASPEIQERIASVEDHIMEEADKAADILESYLTSQILLSVEGQSFTISPPDFSEVIHVFEVAGEEVVKIMNAGQQMDKIIPSPLISSTLNPNSVNRLVGVEGDLNELWSRLLLDAYKLDIIPIVGMGGTGKTTLARILYDECSSSNFHFDCCAWATVSQSYDPQQILKTILACVTGKTLTLMPQENDIYMIDTLYKALSGKTYLIILDDIWSNKVWDGVEIAFPRINNRSRIILTTRENSLVKYVKSKGHEIHLLSEEDSWELLRGKVFGEVSCPHELEEVGKRIASNCRGLPLALQVIGGLLAQGKRRKDYWEYIAHNVSSLIAKTDDQLAGIFSWSFTRLPHYLKPCFLYMCVFPEDHDIPASRLIKLWIAEGFLKPIGYKSLEEAAEIYLNTLVDSNLLYVRRRKKNGKAKAYGVHDLLRVTCLSKAQEKNFLYVKDVEANILQDDKFIRLVSDPRPINDPESSITLKLTSLAHSCLLIGNSKKYKLGQCVCLKPSLLHVLDVYQVKVDGFPEVLLQLVNLRYLAISTKPGEIPRSIYVLTNLQTLIVKYLMSSIALVLALPKLRHFKLDDLIRSSESRHDTFVGPHENLQSLCNIPLEILAEHLLGKLPKLRKLGIKCGYYIDNVDLTCFQLLETLKCFNGFYVANGNFISNITFPNSLQKLTLYSCGVPESLLYAINVLPNLQILKFDACIFMSPDWEPIEGGFSNLRYLLISRVRNLREFLATDLHLPVLQHLVLRNCPALNKIPAEMVDIYTLKTVEIDECKASVFHSAKILLKELHELGNDFFQLRLGSAIYAIKGKGEGEGDNIDEKTT